jgi:hypothetical protein
MRLVNGTALEIARTKRHDLNGHKIVSAFTRYSGFYHFGEGTLPNFLQWMAWSIEEILDAVRRTVTRR